MEHVRVENGTYSSGDIEVEYLFQPARDDRQHLIVIFSGFRALGAVDYYGEAQRSLRANVLWIVDRFDGHFSYYLRAFGGRDVTLAVNSLIDERRRALGLPKSQVTLAGFSKGGSAALYYGIAFDYPRVIAAAPQYRIGSYVKENWPGELEAMTGNSEKNLHDLDTALEDLLTQDTASRCSVVLVTSPSDPQYLAEAAPLAGLLSAGHQFFTVSTMSPHVARHIDVTRYNVPLINSLLTLATEGLAWPSPRRVGEPFRDPAFDDAAGRAVPMICNGMNAFSSALDPERVRQTQAKREALEVAATSVRLEEGGNLFVEGYMFQRGVPVPSYGLFAPSLALHDLKTGAEHQLAVGALKNDELSAAQFEDVWVDYSHAGFASLKNTGFDLSRLPLGRYRVDAGWQKDGVHRSATGITAPRHEVWRLVGDRWIGSTSDAGRWTVHSISIAGRPPLDSYTELTSMTAESSRIYPRGYLVPRGMDHPRWDSVRYGIAALPVKGSAPVRSFTLANDNRRDASEKSGEPWRDQSKATFSTRNHNGLDVSSLAPGDYRLQITARRRDDVQSIVLPGVLTVEDGLPKRPWVGVIGSCVTRDNFSSRVRPGWREDFELHGAFYQSSLISFMAPSLALPDDVVSDLNPHDSAVTLEDMRKGYRQDIERDAPDLLTVDLFADVRMGVIGVGDTWMTDNAWKVQHSAFYGTLDLSRRRSFSERPEEFIELFREACARFAEFARVEAPRTQVVLNKARHVTHHRGFARPGGMFDRRRMAVMNEQWARLDEIFLQEVDAEVIDPMFAGAMGDSDHAWGSGPVHYESGVYDRFRTQLRNIAGVHVETSWSAPEESIS